MIKKIDNDRWITAALEQFMLIKKIILQPLILDIKIHRREVLNGISPIAQKAQNNSRTCTPVKIIMKINVVRHGCCRQLVLGLLVLRVRLQAGYNEKV